MTILHNALNLVQFNCEIMIESVPATVEKNVDSSHQSN